MTPRSKRKRSLAREVQESILRRRRAVDAAMKNPALLELPDSELVVVRCRTCGRPIATPKVGGANENEPPILLELREEHDPERWSCTECGSCRCCGCFLDMQDGDTEDYCAHCVRHVEKGEPTCDAPHMSPLRKKRLHAGAVA